MKKKIQRIPFSTEEAAIIMEEARKAHLRTGTYVRTLFLSAYDTFKEKNLSEIKFTYDLNEKTQINEKEYLNIYVEEEIINGLKKISAVTGIQIPQICRYLINHKIREKD